MKSLLPAVTLVALLSLTACGPGVDPAVGTWTLDNGATLERALAKIEEQYPGEENAGTRKQISGIMEASIQAMQISLELRADGSASSSRNLPNPLGGEGMSSTATGTWTNENGKISLRTTTEGEEPKVQAAELVGGQLVLVEGSGAQEAVTVFDRKAD